MIRIPLAFRLTLLLISAPLTALAAEPATQADGSAARVLILGDSISIGYTPLVREMLEGEAKVVRPMAANGRAENCQGTDYGVEHVDRWLQLDGGDWDVIHFNFGLHDMKRVDPASGAASSDPSHPRQTPVDEYEQQLDTIVQQLKATGAELIFATTTPVPQGDLRPHRDIEDPQRYNDAARRAAKKHSVAINDLYGFAQPRLEEIQLPQNVHFTPGGSRVLAEEVAKNIRAALK